jgi:hypothetical protein
MNTLLLTGMLLSGGWLVHHTNLTYDSLRTCRYRDFLRLQEHAERCAAGYWLVGLTSLIFPGGALVTAAVLSYAFYRRFR